MIVGALPDLETLLLVRLTLYLSLSISSAGHVGLDPVVPVPRLGRWHGRQEQDSMVPFQTCSRWLLFVQFQ